MRILNRKILTIILLTIIVIGIAITIYLVRRQQDVRQRAAGGQATLVFAPKTGPTNYKKGEAFSVGVTVNPAQAVQGFDVVIKYDPQIFDFESIQVTESFEDVLLSQTNETTGVIRIAKGTKSAPGVATATEIAVINFKGLTPGQGLISTHVQPEVVNTNTEAMTVNITPVTITIEDNATPIPTSTPTPIPTNTPTPTLTHTPTPTRTPTPIPPTATFTPSPTRTPTPVPPTATATLAPPTATATLGSPTATGVPTTTVVVCQYKARGDANCDNKVNPQDFVLWKAEYLGQTTSKTADFNGDNSSNPQDFVIWKAGYLDTGIPH